MNDQTAGHGLRLGVDVGGTFTDVVAVTPDGGIITAKVPSTPRDQSVGVMAGWRASGLSAEMVAAFAHGTTVATNALLERRGGRTALITTEGFRDLLEIGRQSRASLYDLSRHRPPPLVPRSLRFTVRERMGPQGVIVPLDESSLAAAVDSVAAAGDVEAVAVCLLFGFLHPDHERRVGEALRARLPGVAVSLSCDVLPEFREYERMATTVADAYLRPRLSSYLERLSSRAEDEGLPAPLIMQSSGGVADISVAVSHPARFVLSGPAGGVVGAGFVAGLSGHYDVLTFDMGGTSTDVAPIVGGIVQTTTESVVAGVPLRLPMVDVHTVSAGGGSVAWVDDGGVLRVGPRSAGADPGPAAYGLGGEEPTVTDAHLVIGALPDGARLGGGLTLRRDLAEQALEPLARRLGLTVPESALGVIRVADATMVQALRLISIERGLDPRRFSLIAFGGAGGLHACALAEELGCPTVLVPRAGGVLSALGLAISEMRRDYVRPFLLAGPDAARADASHDLEHAFNEMERRAGAELGAPSLERRADLRYAGQSFELTVSGGTAGELAAAFQAEHERRYGHWIDDEPVEWVNLRLVASVPGTRPRLTEPGTPGGAAAGRSPVRPVRLGIGPAGEVEAAVYDRGRMGAGSRVEGPAVVEFAEATCLVRPGWTGVVDEFGTLILERR
ncbi:MAG TPA: hydantoinase/oxoprolinase family protein [Acidimicrobiales bacterium]|nr:hydantoinase/oxoprolinase family protein [Acidimicrobiales bacterium]